MRTNFLVFLTAIVAFLLAILLFSTCKPATTPSANPDKEDWISLFNGKNLEGWVAKISGYELGDNYQNTFIAEDSMIKVQYGGYQDFGNRFGHLFYKEPFSYYRLRLEYRFVGGQAPGGQGWALRNSGAMLHCQPPETMPKDQDFPISIEAQFLGGDGEHERHTLNLCTPGTHVVMHDTLVTQHCIESNSKTYHGEQWVAVEFVVLGDSLIQHVIGQEIVLEYSKPQIGGGVVNNFDPAVKIDGKALTGGYISLQSESHPIHFRNLKLLNLEGCTDPKAKNFKSYFVKSNNSLCIYD